MVCSLYPFLVFIQTGYYRVVLVHVKWKKFQTILMKIALILGGTSYFSLGIYFTFDQTSFTNNADPELDSTIQKFIFLFAFAGYDFYLESIALMDDTDGSTQCEYTYKLQSSD